MAAGLKKYDIDPANQDPDGIAETQSPIAGASVILNGALCDAGTALQFDVSDGYSSGIGGVRLLFDSSGSIPTATFTITGKDQDGNSVTEVVTGVTTTAVSTVKYYSQVTSIVVGVATATGLFIGTTAPAEFVTKTIPINRYGGYPAAVAASGLVGTCVFNLEQTFDDMRTTTGDDAAWFVVSAAGTDANSDVGTVAAANATGVRCKFDSYTDGAELQFHVSYNPYR